VIAHQTETTAEHMIDSLPDIIVLAKITDIFEAEKSALLLSGKF